MQIKLEYAPVSSPCLHRHISRKKINVTRNKFQQYMNLKTIENPSISRLTKQIHEVQVPSLCPKTGNPLTGSTLTITYSPDKKLLEIYSLNEYVTSFIGSSEVRDLELLTQVIARDCHEVLNVHVSVIGRYILNVGQTIICECES